MKNSLFKNLDMSDFAKLVLAVVAAGGLFLLSLNCAKPLMGALSDGSDTVIADEPAQEQKVEIADYFLQESDIFEKHGSVSVNGSFCDRFGYTPVNSLCISRLHCFDEATSYVEFYNEGFSSFSACTFLDCCALDYDTDNPLWSHGTILIYGDGRLLKKLNGFHSKMKAESFELDIFDVAFLRIEFVDCYYVATGCYYNGVCLGDLCFHK